MESETLNPLLQAARDEGTQDFIRNVKYAAEAQSFDDAAFSAYFALFGVGMVLLLIWVLRPRQREWKGLLFAGVMLLLLLCAASHQTTIDRQRGFIADQAKRLEKEFRRADLSGPQAREQLMQSHYMYVPSVDALYVMSLGNSAVAADFLWLTSLQYVSSPFRQGNRFELLHRFYALMLELNPHWVEIYVNAARILSAVDPDRDRAAKFIASAMTHNPEDWRIALEGGNLFVVPPNDPKEVEAYSAKAGIFFQTALDEKFHKLPPDDRKRISALAGMLLSEAGKGEAGSCAAAKELLFKNANDPEMPDYLRAMAARQYLTPASKLRAWKLEEMVQDVFKHTGRRPQQLAELFQGRIPADAFGQPFEYDPGSGKVTSRGVLYFQMIQHRHILQSMLTSFQEANGHPPRDLDVLTRFVRTVFGPSNPPPYTVREAFGIELDCTLDPAGKRWDYDPQTGTVSLPPDANAKKLYSFSQYVLKGKEPPLFVEP